MPANLPPTYYEAEKRLREAKTAPDRLEILEEMLTIMPKHKGTDRLRADLRRRIAKVKEESQSKKGGGKGTSYSIDREGAAQVVVVGPPNTGKSSLVAALTNARPEVAPFPHTTWKPTPGMAPYENIKFQLVDTPPISREYIDPWMADLLRRADMLLVMLNLHGDPLEEFEEAMAILGEQRVFAEGHPVPEEMKKRPFFKKILVVVNRVDTVKDEEDFHTLVELLASDLPCVGISVQSGFGLDTLLREVYRVSEIIRVYTRAPGKEPNRQSPFVLPRGSTLEELAEKIHKDFVSKLKFAKIWGKAVFDGQMVQRDHVLQDEDVVELHL